MRTAFTNDCVGWARGGHGGGKEVAEDDAGFDIRQLCVRKHEAEERNEPLMLFLSRPGGAVEVGVLEPLPDLVQEVPARSAVRNMVAGRAAFVATRMKLANDASFAIPRVPDEGARVSFSGEDFSSRVARVVDTELDGLDADFVLSERNQAGVASDGEVGSVAVFADDKAALAFAVELCRRGEVFFRGAALDPELSLLGKLEHGLTTTLRIEHICKVLKRILGS